MKSSQTMASAEPIPGSSSCHEVLRALVAAGPVVDTAPLLPFFHRRLEQLFGVHLPDFLKALHEDHALIGGSFILQVLLDVEWHDADLDIFLPDSCDYYSNSERYCYHQLKAKWEGRTANTYLRHHTGVLSVNNYLYEGPRRMQTSGKIQFVRWHLREGETLYGKLRMATDFEVCMNGLEVISPEGALRLQMLHPQPIMKMHLRVSPRGWLPGVGRRLRKYIERGFTSEVVPFTEGELYAAHKDLLGRAEVLAENAETITVRQSLEGDVPYVYGNCMLDLREGESARPEGVDVIAKGKLGLCDFDCIFRVLLTPYASFSCKRRHLHLSKEKILLLEEKDKGTNTSS